MELSRRKKTVISKGQLLEKGKYPLMYQKHLVLVENLYPNGKIKNLSEKIMKKIRSMTSELYQNLGSR